VKRDDAGSSHRRQGLVLLPLAWPVALPPDSHDHQLLSGASLAAFDIAFVFGLVGLVMLPVGWALDFAINSLDLVASAMACA